MGEEPDRRDAIRLLLLGSRMRQSRGRGGDPSSRGSPASGNFAADGRSERSAVRVRRYRRSVVWMDDRIAIDEYSIGIRLTVFVTENAKIVMLQFVQTLTNNWREIIIQTRGPCTGRYRLYHNNLVFMQSTTLTPQCCSNQLGHNTWSDTTVQHQTSERQYMLYRYAHVVMCMRPHMCTRYRY